MRHNKDSFDRLLHKETSTNHVRSAATAATTMISIKRRRRHQEEEEGIENGSRCRTHSLQDPEEQEDHISFTLPSCNRNRLRPSRRRHTKTNLTTRSCVFAAVILCFLPCISALIPCNTSKDCETVLHRKVSTCLNGTCTNPFASGCLQNTKRVCNSEDSEETIAAGVCHLPSNALSYPEVRIASQNWETPFFMVRKLQYAIDDEMITC